ncbi:transcription initiation factor TFIID component TAF4 family domain-containing protein [Ditylenchus destructor]|uniref:Transcription initiation factor TFIID component TAF4 family domain-containing protein n=1 Tax=Ditylenchus destructor TaxID=166010 RepID=A0AAD4NE13_9BILA|nr:transcription initiation factor TFIID component TAF4 family domain-containing protein [Ditylenchus destructor]
MSQNARHYRFNNPKNAPSIYWYAVNPRPLQKSSMSSQAPSPTTSATYLPAQRPPSAPALHNGNGTMTQPRIVRLVNTAPPSHESPNAHYVMDSPNRQQPRATTMMQPQMGGSTAMGVMQAQQQPNHSAPRTVVYSTTPTNITDRQASASPAMRQPSSDPPQQRPLGNGGANQPNDGTVSRETVTPVMKCAKFFTTLLHLSQRQSQSNTIAVVRQLIRGVVFGNLSPENFTNRLQRALGSPAQKNLLTFLRDTLPALRTALRNGEQVIEGIGTAEEYEQENQDGSLDIIDDVLPATNGTVADGQKQPIQAVKNEPNRFATPAQSRVGLMLPPQAAPPRPPSQPSTIVVPLAEVKSEVDPLSTLDTSIDSVIHNVTATSTSTLTAAPIVVDANEMETTGLVAGTSAIVPISEDQLPNTLLNSQAIADRIFERMPECEGLEPDVLELISNAAETRLRALAGALSMASEHRLEPLRLTPYYKQLDEPRKQLRFMEDIEKHAHERRENQEREALLRFSKSKAKDKDAMEKAKQVQKADKEAAMNRDANAAAIAALGGSRGIKRPGSSNTMHQVAGNPIKESASAGLTVQTHRPRMKRVTIRDLQFALSSDSFNTSPAVRHRLFLGLRAPTNPRSIQTSTTLNVTKDDPRLDSSQ